MTCTPIRMSDGTVGIICTRVRQRRRICQVPGCFRPAERQCDFKLDRLRYKRNSGSTTCDHWLCVRHAVNFGDKDYCPHHDLQDVPKQLSFDLSPGAPHGK